MNEKDPFGLDPHKEGAKLDSGKPKVSTYCLRYFPRALMEVAKISEYGAEKYTKNGWKKVPDGEARYEDAEIRHILYEEIEEYLYDEGSQLLHAAHKAWNALATLELLCRRTSRWTQKPQDLTSEKESNHSSSQPAQKMDKQEDGDGKSTHLQEKLPQIPETSTILWITSKGRSSSSTTRNSTLKRYPPLE